MAGRGLVLSVDQVTAKQGEPAWQIVTDAENRFTDGLNRCAFWVPRPGPIPPIGATVTWGPHNASWASTTVRKIDHEFDPNDPALFTG